MIERRTVPPLSGEIMAAAEPGRTARFDMAGAAEGDYETVPAKPADAPRTDAPPPRARPAGMAVLDELAPAPPPRRRAGPAFWIFGVALAAAAFWTAGGHVLFAREAARPRTAVGVHFATLTTRIVPGAGREIVLVDGELLNDGQGTRVVPPLDIAVTGRDGAVTRYVMGPSGEAILSGGRYAFSSRLQAPKGGAESVVVTVRREKDEP